MARLASQRKGQFYPTPSRAMQLLTQNVQIQGPPGYILNIADLSCGEGDALAYLCQAWNGKGWGNELEKSRFAKAKSKLFHCTLGMQETLEVNGQFDVIFLNPPYDQGAGKERLEVEHVAQAIGWLRIGGLFVAVVPMKVLTLESFWNKWYQHMSIKGPYRFPNPEYQAFSQCVVIGQRKREAGNWWAFVKPMLTSMNRVAAGDAELAVLGAEELLVDMRGFTLKGPTVTRMKNRLPDAHEVLSEIEELGDLFDSTEWQNLTIPPPTMVVPRPAMPTRATHVVQLAAAGMLNGYELVLDGERCVISGGSQKYTVTVESDIEDVESGIKQHKKVETEKLAYRILTFSMETGRLRIIDSRDRAAYEPFLRDHVQELIDAANLSNPPWYQMDYSRWVGDFNKLHSPRKLPGRDEDGLFVAQKHVAAAMLETFRRSPAAVLVGEVGTGKTVTALATMALESGMRKDTRIVVLCPAIVAKKWADEAAKILSEFGVKVGLIGYDRQRSHLVAARPGSVKEEMHRQRAAVIYQKKKAKRLLQPAEVAFWDGLSEALKMEIMRPAPKPRLEKIGKAIQDVDELMNSDGPAVLIVTNEIAKNGARWDHAVQAGPKRKMSWTIQEPEMDWKGDKVLYYKDIVVSEELTIYRCPGCKHELINDDGRPWMVAEELIPIDDPSPRQRGRRMQQVCPACGSALWQVLPFKYGGRWPVAERLCQSYGGRYYLIIDEAHRTKSGDTDIGLASQDMISGAKKTIAMTGTIFNGLAGSLFYLMYRLSPEFRKLYHHDECSVFVAHHGLVETITTETSKATRHGYSGYGRKPNVRTREAPGATPSMVALLMEITHFLTLEDVGMQLPPKQEFVVPVNPGIGMQMGMSALHRLEEDAKKALVVSDGKNKGPHSRWFQAALGWLDRPEEEIIDNVTIPAFDWMAVNGAKHLPKDGVVVNLVKENIAEGRGVGIFCEQVNRRDPLPRIASVLEQCGIHVSILRSKVDPWDRMEWILEAEAETKKKHAHELVLLCNGSLVGEGVDLLMLPTMIEIGQHYNITELMQRLGRSHRLGQMKDVRLYFTYYESTQQQNALVRIALKLKTAKQVDGRVAEGLAAWGSEEDFIQEMMRHAGEREGDRLAQLMQVRLVSDRVIVGPVSASPDRMDAAVRTVEVPVRGSWENGDWAHAAEVWKQVLGDLKSSKAAKKAPGQLTFFEMF